jgi:heme/copper-type cytochrome/quinol oxidase subunit 3
MSEYGYVAGDRALGEGPHTTEATDAAAVSRVVARRLGPPAAWWGIVILVASEGTLFAAFIGTYYYLRFRAPAWPPHGIPEPRLVVPLVLTGCLLLTSVPMQLASLAARAGRLAATRIFLLLALVIQTGYFAYECHDFGDQLRKVPISIDAYSSIYYTLLGADHAHVFLGLLFDVWLLWKLARGFTTYRVNATQAITWYWHAVNVLTLVVIGTLLSANV